MAWFFSDWVAIGEACGKTALLAGSALAGFRLAPRRALAEMRIFDFVVVIAAGAVIGRTATAAGTAFAVGFAALLTLLLLHVTVARLRFFRPVRRLLDHPVRVLVADGRIDHAQLRACQLTEDDLLGALRRQGVRSVGDVESVLYESQGGFTVRRQPEPR